MNLYDKALEEAVNTALSDLGGLTAEQIVERLDTGEIPEEVAVWSPFEYYDAENLLDVIDGFRAQFERFANDLLLKTGEK